jgi:diguanylate cyclase (GGDEF)-like protein
MANPYTSILVVDDARFSTTVITRTLQMGGYKNIRRASSAVEALEIQESDPASVMIVDWLMPNMDGLELTGHVRQMDEASNRYTYVIMLTAKDGTDALQHAFDEGIDDFVNKSAMQEQLLPRVYAAERLVDNQNRLLAQCQELVEVNRDLQRLCTIDPLTGLGNKTYGLEKINSTLQHTESRGGATSLLLLEIHNFDTIQRQLQSHVFEELIVGISRRLRALMRPLDTVTRFNDKTFMIITHQSDISLASASSFKRIQEGINLRAFKTSTGFHSLQVSISILCCSGEFGIPDSDMLIQRCQEGLDEAKATGRIAMNYYREI